MTDEVKKLYTALLSKGYSTADLGDESTFRSKMSDKNNRRDLYDWVSSKGNFRLGDYDTYERRLTSTPTNTPTTQLSSQQVDIIKKTSDALNNDTAPVFTEQQLNEGLTSTDNAPLTGFWEGAAQGGNALVQGNIYGLGETLDLFQKDAQEYKDAIALLDSKGADFDASKFDADTEIEEAAKARFDKRVAEYRETMKERKKERENMGIWDKLVHIANDPSAPNWNETNHGEGINEVINYNRPINLLAEALKKSGGDVKKARAILEEKSNMGETYAQKLMRESSEKLADMRPVEGLAWWGQMIPQMTGQAVALGLRAIPHPVAQGASTWLGLGSTAALTGSAMGSTMHEARQSGATNGVWKSGLLSGAIELGTEAIPFGRLFDRVGASAVREGVRNAVTDASEAELNHLLKWAKDKIGGKFLSYKTGKALLQDMGVEGLSEAVAGLGESFIPMAYGGELPTFEKTFTNMGEGFLAGVAMGGFLGGGSSYLVHRGHESRRKANGGVALGEYTDKDGKTEIVEVTYSKGGQSTILHQDGSVETVETSTLSKPTFFTYEEWETNVMDVERAKINAAYNQGAQTTNAQDIRDIGDAFEADREYMVDTYGEDFVNSLDEDAVSVVHGLGDKQKDDALRYAEARARFAGYANSKKEEVSEKIKSAHELIDSHISQDDGMIRPATLTNGERKVYIMSGDVAQNDLGGIDVNASSKSIVVADAQTGELEMISPEDFLSVEGALNPQGEKDAIAQSIQNEYNDAAWVALNGYPAFGAGENHTILGENGTPIQVSVVADNGDGTVSVTADGKNVFPYSKDAIANYEKAVRKAQYMAQRGMQSPKEIAPQETTASRYNQGDVVTYTDEAGNTFTGTIVGEPTVDGVAVGTPDGVQLVNTSIINNGLVEVKDADGNVVWSKNNETGQAVAEETAQPQVAPENSVLSRIPTNEEGEHLYEQADSNDAWDALLEQTDGDIEMAQKVAQDMVAVKEAALKKAQSAKVRATTNVAVNIAAEKERKAIIEKAEQDLDAWKQIAGVQERRRLEAEEQQRLEAEAAARAEMLLAEENNLSNIPDMVDDTPQDARARGYRRVSGQKVERPSALQGYLGNKVGVKFANNAIPEGRVMVIEADNLQPSHTQGQRNPMHFLDEAQPKERKDAASLVATQRIASDIRPEEITSSVTAYTGAPTTNGRGEVIQGNSRSDALKLMWDSYPESAAKYKQYLIDHAEELGLDAEGVASMQRPVLVNMLDVTDADAITLGQYVAQDTESGGTERIKPKNVIQKMGNKMNLLAHKLLDTSDEDASFAQLVDENGTEVIKWMAQQGYITDTQYASAFDSKGNLTAEAKNDLRGMMFQSIFKGGSTQLEEMFNAMPTKAQKAILATAFRDYDSPVAERMIGNVQESIRAFYLLSQNADFASAKNYEEARNAVEAWKNQYQMDDVSGESYLPADNFSNFALELATLYKGRTQGYVQSVFNNMFDLIQGTVQADLFQEADTRKRTLAEAIKETLNIDYNGRIRRNVLADNSTDGTAGGQGSTRDSASGEQNQSREESSERGRGVGISDTKPGRQGDIADITGRQHVISSQKELDENGHPFVVSSNGTTTFGVITEDTGLPTAPIKLSEGFQNEDGKGYGLLHIEANHGQQIRNAGFSSVEEFVSFVATNYDENNIRVGKRRDKNGSITYLLQVTDEHDNTLFIELSRDGSYWNVNSGGVFRKGYSNKKRTVVKTEPQQPNNAVSTDSSLSESGVNGITPTEPNGESTVPFSNSKGTDISSEKQKTEGENVDDNERKSPIAGYSYNDVIDGVTNDIQNALSEAGIEDEVTIDEVWAHGSRMRGDAKEDSDLDVVLFYKGDSKEDALFNAINEAGISINGINVDVNPIQVSTQKDIDRYKQKSAQYDAEVSGKRSDNVATELTAQSTWDNLSPQERLEHAEINPLTAEEIESSTADEVNKANAIAYLNGTQNLITQISYLQVYEDVRIRPTSAPSDNGAGNRTQLAEADSNASTERGRGGESRTSPLRTGKEGGTDRERVSDGGAHSEGESDLLSGESGDNSVRGSQSSVDGVSSRGTNSGRGGTTRSKRSDGGRDGRSTSHRNAEVAGKQSSSIDEELNAALGDFKAVLSEFTRAGRETLSISIAGLNNKQLEILPKLISAGTKVGYAFIKKGVTQLNAWAKEMKALIGNHLSDAGLTDVEVDAFIEELWNSHFPIGEEVHTIGEWASILGMEKTRSAIKSTLKDKKALQDAAESISVKVGDAANIAETLPFLLPQQQDDVLKAETQFFDESHNDREHAFGKGYMFTNGTGTGKTYTGLGIVKRFIKQGKGRILIVTPSQQKVTDWIGDAKNLNIPLRSLDDFAKEQGTTATQTSGEGTVITTFANFRENAALLEGVFDLVVYDESHRILENKQGTETAGARQHYMVTNRDANSAFMRLREINTKYKTYGKAQDEYNSVRDAEIEKAGSSKNIPGVHNPLTEEYKRNYPKLYKAKENLLNAEESWGKEEIRLKEQAEKDAKVTKVVFLSATPFNTRDNLDYAERYIFTYPEEDPNTVGSYKHQSPRTRFYLEYFGGSYKFRYGRLEKAGQDSDVIARQEIAFSDYLQNTLQTMSGRVIDSEYDYSRDFPTVLLAMGDRINDAISSITEDESLRPLWSARHKVWYDYNYSNALFETMKISAMAPRLKQHLDAGRKVVIFHRRVETKHPLTPPFALMLSVAEKEMHASQNAEEKKALKEAILKFRAKNADLLEWEKTLNYSMPREQLAQMFGNDKVLFFSGKESAKVKNDAVSKFNDDNSGKNIIVIQEASGKEGISLHDRTGKHQRVVITLALPQSPITALQIEGRIYRIGNKSNAIFEYPILGLDSEMVLFGQNFNKSVSTTENLALGSQARNLRDSFARGIEERSGDIPVEEQGVGGKEADASKITEQTPYDNAILDYYTNQKITARRDQREGLDYYPTPEPLGFMMNEWGRVKEGDELLEPSAGHGAIARYAPTENKLTAIEPSGKLFSRLQIKVGGASGRNFVNDIFENYNIVNKHDVILMNPPFGVAGKLAAEHVEKAFKHLTEGGRIVAIVPEGKAQDRIGKWLDSQKDAVVVGEVLLPDVTFKQAGTNIKCRVVVIDKITNERKRLDAAARKVTHNLGYVETIEEFFNELQGVSMPDRTIDTQLIMQKRAKRYVGDLKDIKGVKEVVVNQDSVNVRTKGWRNFFIDWSNYSGNALKDYLARQYKDFANKILIADESSREIMLECQSIICKLANMTEDEMERYISNMGKGDTLYRSDEDVVQERGYDAESVETIIKEFGLNPPALSEIINSRSALEWYSSRIDENIYEGVLQSYNKGCGGVSVTADRYSLVFIFKEYCKGALDEQMTWWHEQAHCAYIKAKFDKMRLAYDALDWLEDNAPFRYNNILNSYDRAYWEDEAVAVFIEELVTRYGTSKFLEADFAELGELATLADVIRNSIKNGTEDTNKKIKAGYRFGKPASKSLPRPVGRQEDRPHHREGSIEERHRITQEFRGDASQGTGRSEADELNRNDGRSYTDDELSVMSDPMAKMLSASTYSARQRREFAERARKRMVNRVETLAKQLHLDNVEIVTDASTLEGKKQRAKGFFSKSTGKITIVIPNHAGTADVEQTVLHEAVAHYGLRKLFGEHFDTFLDNVFNHASTPIRKKIIELAQKNGWDFRTATEEYLATLAEDAYFESAKNPSSGWWSKIKSFFMDMLAKAGVQLDYTLTDNELRYILWRSYQNLANPGRYNSVVEQATDIAKQYELKVGNYREGVTDADALVGVAEKQNDELFRDGTTRERAEARERYERRVKSGLYQSQEALQDSMLGLKVAMQEIVGEDVKIEDIAGFENAYLGENRLSSVNKAEVEMFVNQYFKPLYDVVKVLAPTEEERKALEHYMIAKHGLERNAYMRNQDIENGVKGAEFKDYAGLTALTGLKDVAEAEIEAQRMVEAFENSHRRYLDDFWSRWRAITDANLLKTYQSGIIDKATLDKISSMYEYYVPLRGFDETTSVDVYAYLGKSDNAFNPAIKKAEGRKSVADNPFAYLESMVESTIMQGNRNVLVKQRMLNFVQNHPSDLFSVSDLWLEYNDRTGEWETAFPDISEYDSPEKVRQRFEDFEAKMEELAASRPDKVKKSSDAKGIPFRVVTKQHLNEHQVIVKRNGKNYVITVNGSPRAAQALNGLTNPDNTGTGAFDSFLRAGETINRHLSSFYTTRNPDFVVSNFMRDMLYANTMVWVKESPNYALKFHKNVAICNPKKMLELYRKYRNGELNMSDELESGFYQFMMNGGETGYTNVKDIEKRKKEIAKKLRSKGIVGSETYEAISVFLDEVNRSVENCARFATYMTSRQMGRSLDRSIYDAKEISVNFNKKGAGDKFLNAQGQTALGDAISMVSSVGRSGYVFWNAAIQGSTNFGRQVKRNPKKAIGAAAVMFMLGSLMAYFGDDDEEDKNAYYNIPEYVRRSNILIRLGDEYLSLPLPIEYRAFYGMGELMVSVMSGKEHLSDVELAEAIASQVSQVLPLDVLEGGGVVSALTPSVFKPIVEAYALNKSWTGLPIYKDTPFNENDPEWTKAYSNVNPIYLEGAKLLNEWTGGDAHKSGVIDFNPARFEYVLEGYLGGFASVFDKLVKMGETVAGEREYDPRSFLLWNRLVKSGDERTELRAINNQYWKIKEEAERTEELWRDYIRDTKLGVFDYAEKIHFLEQSPEFRRFTIYEWYGKEISKLERELKLAKELGNEELVAGYNEVINAYKKEVVELINATYE